MEIKATLQKPYEENERMDFIVQYNHGMGYAIEETETELQALGYTEEEIAIQERERIAKLYLTGADVERGIYQAKGIDFEDIIEMVETLIFAEAPQVKGIDLKALRIELKANHFYRGNPYVGAVGGLLGFTIEQLDKFFETNDYTYLLPPVEPEEPTVSEMEIVEEPVVNNSERTTEENSVIEDVPKGDDVNNSEE